MEAGPFNICKALCLTTGCTLLTWASCRLKVGSNAYAWLKEHWMVMETSGGRTSGQQPVRAGDCRCLSQSMLPLCTHASCSSMSLV